MPNNKKSSKSTVTKSVKVMLIASLMLCFVFAGATVQSQKWSAPVASVVQASQAQSPQTEMVASGLSGEFAMQGEGVESRDGAGSKPMHQISIPVPNSADIKITFYIWFSWQSSFLGSSKIKEARLDDRWIYGDGIDSNQIVAQQPGDGVYGMASYKSEFYHNGNKIDVYVTLQDNYRGNTDERDASWGVEVNGVMPETGKPQGHSRWYVPHNGQPTEQDIPLD
ncbi:MAG: hypothetical protein FWD76_05960 [Firmicutes bacterium]|nr:hypothetical protein [Bacillota bacterium]